MLYRPRILWITTDQQRGDTIHALGNKHIHTPNLDENVGRLLDELDRAGHRENTVVIFTSDHGNLIGDHGLNQKGCRFYEGLVRVPLIVSWPGHLREGRVENGRVELTDLVETVYPLLRNP